MEWHGDPQTCPNMGLARRVCAQRTCLGPLPRDSDSVVGQGGAQGSVFSTQLQVIVVFKQVWNVFVCQ